MSFIARLFRSTDDRAPLIPLYNAIVTRGREPHWYVEGGVADTLDGRFDMIAAILSLVLIRLEGDEDSRLASARLTELFVSDMDGQLRQIGIGDVMVGKHIGKMMAALGGRLTAYRAALGGDDAALGEALARNLYRGDAPPAGQLAHVVAGLRAFADALAAGAPADLVSGALPRA